MANSLVMEIESILEALRSVDGALESLGEKRKIVLDIETKWDANEAGDFDADSRRQMRDQLMDVIKAAGPELMQKLARYESGGFKVERIPRPVARTVVEYGRNPDQVPNEGMTFRPAQERIIPPHMRGYFPYDNQPRPLPANEGDRDRYVLGRSREYTTTASNEALFGRFKGRFNQFSRFFHNEPIFGPPSTPPSTRVLPFRAPPAGATRPERTEEQLREIRRAADLQIQQGYAQERANYTPWDVFDARNKQIEKEIRRRENIAAGVKPRGRLPEGATSFDFDYAIVADTTPLPRGIPQRQLLAPDRSQTRESITKSQPIALGQIGALVNSIGMKLENSGDPVAGLIRRTVHRTDDVNGLLDALEFALSRLASNEPGSSYYESVLGTLEDRGTLNLPALAKILNQLQSAADRATATAPINKKQVRENLRHLTKVSEASQALVKTGHSFDDDPVDEPYDVRVSPRPTYFRGVSTHTGINSFRTSIGSSRARDESKPHGSDVGIGSQVAGFQTSQLLTDGRDQMVYGLMKQIHDEAAEDLKAGRTVGVMHQGVQRQIPVSLMRASATYARSASQLAGETTHRGKIGEARGPLGVVQSPSALTDYASLYGGYAISNLLSGGSLSDESFDDFALKTVYTGSEDEKSSTGISIYAARLRERLEYERERERRKLATEKETTLVPHRMNEIARLNKQIGLFDEIMRPDTTDARRGEIVFPRSVADARMIPLTQEQALAAMFGKELASVPAFPDIVATITPQARQISDTMSAAGIASHGRPYVQGTALNEVFRRLQQGAPAEDIADVPFPDYGGGRDRYGFRQRSNLFDTFRDAQYETTGTESKGMQGLIAEMFGMTNTASKRGTIWDSIFHASRAATEEGKFKTPDQLRASMPNMEHGLMSILSGADDLRDIGHVGLPILDFAQLATNDSRTALESATLGHIREKMPELDGLPYETLQKLAKVSKDQSPDRILAQVAHLVAPQIQKVISRIIKEKASKSGMSDEEYRQMIADYHETRTVPRGFEELFKQREFWDPSQIHTNPELNNALQLLKSIPDTVYQPGDQPSSILARLTGREDLLDSADRMTQAVPELSGSYGLQNTARDVKENALGRVGSNIVARSYDAQAALGPLENGLRIRRERIKQLRTERDTHPETSPEYERLSEELLMQQLMESNFLYEKVRPARHDLGQSKERERLRLQEYLLENGTPDEQRTAAETLALARATQKLLGVAYTTIDDSMGYTGTQQERFNQEWTRQTLVADIEEIAKSGVVEQKDWPVLQSMRKKLARIEAERKHNQEAYEGTHAQDLVSIGVGRVTEPVHPDIVKAIQGTALNAALDRQDSAREGEDPTYMSAIPLDHLIGSADRVNPKKAAAFGLLSDDQIMTMLKGSGASARRSPLIGFVQDVDEAMRAMEADRASRSGEISNYASDPAAIRNAAYRILSSVHDLRSYGTASPFGTAFLTAQVSQITGSQRRTVRRQGTQYSPEVITKAQEVVTRLQGKDKLSADETRELATAQGRLQNHSIRLINEKYGENEGVMQLFDAMFAMAPRASDKSPEAMQRAQIVKQITEQIARLSENDIERLKTVDFTDTASLSGLLRRNPENVNFRSIVALLGNNDVGKYARFGRRKGATAYGTAVSVHEAAKGAIDDIQRNRGRTVESRHVYPTIQRESSGDVIPVTDEQARQTMRVIREEDEKEEQRLARKQAEERDLARQQELAREKAMSTAIKPDDARARGYRPADMAAAGKPHWNRVDTSIGGYTFEPGIVPFIPGFNPTPSTPIPGPSKELHLGGYFVDPVATPPPIKPETLRLIKRTLKPKEKEEVAKLREQIDENARQQEMLMSTAEGLPLIDRNFVGTVKPGPSFTAEILPLLKSIDGIAIEVRDDATMEKDGKSTPLGMAQYSQNRILINLEAMKAEWERQQKAIAAGKPLHLTSTGARKFQKYNKDMWNDNDSTARKSRDFTEYRDFDDYLTQIIYHELSHFWNRRYRGEDSGNLEDRVDQAAKIARLAARKMPALTADQVAANPDVKLDPAVQMEIGYKTPDTTLQRERITGLVATGRQLAARLDSVLHNPWWNRTAPRNTLDAPSGVPAGEGYVDDSVGDAEKINVRDSSQRKKKIAFFDLETQVSDDPTNRVIYQAAHGMHGVDKVDTVYAGPTAYVDEMVKVAQDTSIDDAERKRRFSEMARHDEKGNVIPEDKVSKELIDSMFQYAQTPGARFLTQDQVRAYLKTKLAGNTIAGHNIDKFDISTLFNGMVPGGLNTQDTLSTVQTLYPGSHTLGDSYKILTGKDIKNAHMAGSDVQTNKELYDALFDGDPAAGKDVFQVVMDHLESTTSKKGFPYIRDIVNNDPSRLPMGSAERADAVKELAKSGAYYQSLAALQRYTELGRTGYLGGSMALPTYGDLSDPTLQTDKKNRPLTSKEIERLAKLNLPGFKYKKTTTPAGEVYSLDFADDKERQANQLQLHQQHILPNLPYTVNNNFGQMRDFIARRLGEEAGSDWRDPFMAAGGGLSYGVMGDLFAGRLMDPAGNPYVDTSVGGATLAISDEYAVRNAPSRNPARPAAPVTAVGPTTASTAPSAAVPTTPLTTPTATIPGMSDSEALDNYNEKLKELKRQKKLLMDHWRSVIADPDPSVAFGKMSTPEAEKLFAEHAAAAKELTDFESNKDAYIKKLTSPSSAVPPSGTPPVVPPGGTPPGGTPPGGTPPVVPPGGGGRRPITIYADVANVYANTVNPMGGAGTSTTPGAGGNGLADLWAMAMGSAGSRTTLSSGAGTTAGTPDPVAGTLGLNASIENMHAQHVTIQLMGGSLHVAGEVSALGGSGFGGSGGPRYGNRVQGLLSLMELNRSMGIESLQGLNGKPDRDLIKTNMANMFGGLAQRALSGPEFERARLMMGADPTISMLDARPTEGLLELSARAYDIGAEHAALSEMPTTSLTKDQVDRLNELNQVNPELALFIQLIKELSGTLQRTVSSSATRPEYGYAGTEFDPSAPRGRAYGSDPTDKQIGNYRNSFQMQALKAFRNAYDQQGGAFDSTGFGADKSGTGYGTRNNLIEMTRKYGIVGSLQVGDDLNRAVQGANKLGLTEQADAINAAMAKITSDDTSFDDVPGHLMQLMESLSDLATAARKVGESSTATADEVEAAASVTQNLGKVQQHSAGAINEQRTTSALLEQETNKRLADLRENLQANAGRQTFFGVSAIQMARRISYLQEYTDRLVGPDNRDLLLRGGTALGYNARGGRVNIKDASEADLVATRKQLESRGIKNVTLDELRRYRRTLQEEEQTKNQTPMANPLQYLTNKARDLQYWAQSIMSLPDTVTGILEQATSPALGAIRTMTTARALSLSPETYKNALGAATTQQQMYGGSLSKNMASVTSFIPVANAYGVDIQKTVNTARKLAAFDPAQGMEGASIAIKEFLSGNVSSLSRRFEINRSSLSKINTGDANQMLESLDNLLSSMGVTDRLIDEQANSLATKYDKMLGRLEILQQGLSMMVVSTLTGPLDMLLGPQSSLAKYLVKNTINTPLKESIKFAGDSALTNIEDGTDNLNSLNINSLTFFDDLDVMLAKANDAMIKQIVTFDNASGFRVNADMFNRMDNLNDLDKQNFRIQALSNVSKGMTNSQAIINGLTESGLDYAGYQQFAGRRMKLGEQGSTAESLKASLNQANQELASVKGLRVKVLQVSDADTIQVRMPDGKAEWIRTFGIDAPEKMSGPGKQATAAFNRQLADSGGYVNLNKYYGKDVYGSRSLYSFSMDDKQGNAYDSGASLIAQGYASAYDYGNADPRVMARYFDLEAQAGDRGIGPINAEAAAAGLGGLPTVSDEARRRSYENRYGWKDMATMGLGVAGISAAVAAGVQSTLIVLKTAGLFGAAAAGGASIAGGGLLATAAGVGTIAAGAGMAGRRLYTGYIDDNDSSQAAVLDRYDEELKLRGEQQRSGIIGRSLREQGISYAVANAAATRHNAAVNPFGTEVFSDNVEKVKKSYTDLFSYGFGGIGPAEKSTFWQDLNFAFGGPQAVEDSVKVAYEQQYTTTSNERLQQFEKTPTYAQNMLNMSVSPSMDSSMSKLMIPIFEDTTQLKTAYDAFVAEQSKSPQDRNQAIIQMWTPKKAKILAKRMAVENMLQSPDNEKLLERATALGTTVKQSVNRDEEGRVLNRANDLAAYGIDLSNFQMSETVTPKLISDYIRNNDPFHFEETLRQLEELAGQTPGTYIQEAKKYMDSSMEKRQQLRMTRFTNLAEGAAALAYTGAIQGPDITRPGLAQGTPEYKAVAYLRGSSIDPSPSGNDRAGQEITAAIHDAAKNYRLTADVFGEQAQVAYAFDAQYKSTFGNFVDAVKRAGDGFSTIANNMGQGNPRFMLDFLAERTGINYKSTMQQYQLLPGQMPQMATGPGQTGFNTIGPSVEFGYSQGPMGTLQMAQDTLSNKELVSMMNPGEMASLIMQASAAQTQLVQTNIRNGHQARDLAIQNARSIEDINRNGMISLENIHRSFTQQMLVLAEQDEVNKRLNRVTLQELTNTAPNLTPEQRDTFNKRLQTETMEADQVMQFNMVGYLDDNPNDQVIKGFSDRLKEAGPADSPEYRKIWDEEVMPYVKSQRAILDEQIKNEKDPKKRAELETLAMDFAEAPDVAKAYREEKGASYRRDVIRAQNAATDSFSLADAQRNAGELQMQRSELLTQAAKPGQTPQEIARLNSSLASNQAAIAANDRQIANLTTSLNGSQSVIGMWADTTKNAIDLILTGSATAAENATKSVNESMISLETSLAGQALNFQRSVSSMQQQWIDASLEIKRQVPANFAEMLTGILTYNRAAFNAEVLYRSGDKKGAEELLLGATTSLADIMFPKEYTNEPGDRRQLVEDPKKQDFIDNIMAMYPSKYPAMDADNGNKALPKDLNDFAVSVPGGYALRVMSFDQKQQQTNLNKEGYTVKINPSTGQSIYYYPDGTRRDADGNIMP